MEKVDNKVGLSPPVGITQSEDDACFAMIGSCTQICSNQRNNVRLPLLKNHSW